MNNNELQSFMRREISNATPSSKIARIRSMFSELEDGLNSGLTLEWMANKLTEGGLSITGMTLGSYMRRIRKERSTVKASPSSVSSPAKNPPKDNDASMDKPSVSLPKTVKDAAKNKPDLHSLRMLAKGKN